MELLDLEADIYIFLAELFMCKYLYLLKQRYYQKHNILFFEQIYTEITACFNALSWREQGHQMQPI